MLAVNYSEFEKNLEKYCDQAAEDYENVFVTRKDNKNIVIKKNKYTQQKARFFLAFSSI